MNSTIPGAAGAIELAITLPASAPRVCAVVAHPHPLFGGTMTNKVVTTLARSLNDLGYVVARFNFRGVGASEGVHDEGRGETADCVAVIEHLQAQHSQLPMALAGFSFGGAVALAAAQQRIAAGHSVSNLLLVAPAFSRISKWAPEQTHAPPVGTRVAVIHGDVDDVVPLSSSLDWAREFDQGIVVVPGAEHFFHQRLHHIKRFVHDHAAQDYAAPRT
jgi:uncharacterized protein